VNGTVTGDPNKKFDFKEPKVEKGDIAVIETNLGTIRFTFLTGKAKLHIANFEKLAEAGFYDGVKFHRVIPGFMIQTGDPNSKGSNRGMYGQGGPGWTVKDEFNDTPFERGIVGMAKTGAPDSAGSQFFIMVSPNPSLNGHYTAFGKVTEGMDVADKIVNVNRDGADDPLPPHEVVVKSIKIVHPGGH
jgi:cyclophilin family peptidyl-prolyl cis-trans isomerase